MAAWGVVGSGLGQFRVPTSIAIDGDGNFYVADVENSRVLIFSASGIFLSELAPGSLSGPHGLAFDSMGNFYVADTGNNSVKKFKLADTPAN